MIFGVLNLD